MALLGSTVGLSVAVLAVALSEVVLILSVGFIVYEVIDMSVFPHYIIT